MEKENSNNPITISARPSEVDLTGITITKGQCIANSINVATRYPEIEIVEGIIIVVHENRGKPMQHAWNRKGDIHFDVTNEKVWTGESDMNEASSISYFPTIYHKRSDIGSKFEFSAETNAGVNKIKDLLSKKE